MSSAAASPSAVSHAARLPTSCCGHSCMIFLSSFSTSFADNSEYRWGWLAGWAAALRCLSVWLAVDRRTWHSRGNNFSDITRKVIFIGYSYRWMRGLDYNLMEEELLSRCTPIRRQLLGDGHNIKGWWQVRQSTHNTTSPSLYHTFSSRRNHDLQLPRQAHDGHLRERTFFVFATLENIPAADRGGRAAEGLA